MRELILALIILALVVALGMHRSRFQADMQIEPMAGAALTDVRMPAKPALAAAVNTPPPPVYEQTLDEVDPDTVNMSSD